MPKLAAIALFVTFIATPLSAQEREADLERILSFEVEHVGTVPSGWSGGPPSTLFVDREIVYNGSSSGRIVRDTEATTGFSSLTKGFDIDFAGAKVEIRAFLKTENVVGWAGLWIRLDGDSGPVGFKNHQDLNLHGTSEWAEYSLELDLTPQATQLFFGALLAGTGRVWIDDVRLLVDGEPLSEAPKAEIPETVIDHDAEFDEGSGIAIAELSARQIEHVARLGRIWGFLKYHHPAVTGGNHHWDYELFRILPSVLTSPDSETANDVIHRWINGLGDVDPCEECPPRPEGNVHLRPDLKWIEDAGALGADLSATLQLIYERSGGAAPQFFVGPFHPSVGNPEFRNEPTYPGIALPDAGFQLLTLFRYWNIIEYWFPYRDVIGEDWPSVLMEYVPRMASANARDAFEAQLATLIARINDTHGGFRTDARPPQGACALPVRVRIVDGRAVVAAFGRSDYEQESGLAIGDVIEAIDGKGVEDLFAEWTPYYAASNDPVRRAQMARVLTVGECGAVVIAGRRGDELFRRELARVTVSATDRGVGWTHDREGDTFQLLDPRVAYLKLSSVEAASAGNYVERAAGTHGLVVDIRNYPAEFVVFSLGRLLVETPTPFARFTRADFSTPGRFSFTDPVVLTPAQPHYGGKIVILVDEASISQSEYTAMALSAGPNAIVVGSTTAGADGNVSRIPLPGGMSTMISGIGVFYPDKRPTQRIGIIPDIEVTPTINGIRSGRDEVLERAIREILGDGADEAEIRRIAR